MVSKKFLLFLLLIFILSISAVSAHENITDDINAHDDYAVQESSDIGNFTGLNDEISNIAAGEYYTLKKDYVYNLNESDFINGVKITEDNVVIDGDGHTIDGAGIARIFDIVSNNVTLKNINFVNGHSTGNGGAIFANGSLNILNSTFVNNVIENIYFYYNYDKNGGAVYFNNTGMILNSNFTDNRAVYYGGAVYFASNGTITDSNFNGNEAQYGGSVCLSDAGEVNNCNFTNNNAVDGGAIVAYGDLSISNSGFENNTAYFGTNHVNLKGNATITLINVDQESIKPYYLGNMTVISTTNVRYGEPVIIIVNVTDKDSNPFNNGTISYQIAGKTYSVDVENGTAKMIFNNMGAGEHGVHLIYEGNGYIANAWADFSVFQQEAVITAVSKAYIINYGGKYYITLKDINGKLIKGNTVDFKLNNQIFKSGPSGANGVATLLLTPKILKAAKAGTKTVEIRISGTDYYSRPVNVKITILKEKTKIVGVNKNFIKSKKIKVYAAYLKDSKGKVVKKALVTLKVNGKLYKVRTNLKGQAIFKITNLNKKGKFNAAIRYAGDGYYQLSTRNVLFNVR